jgi:hypothetical protein
MADPTIFEYQIIDDEDLMNRSAIYVAYDGATTTVDSLVGSWLEVGGLIDPCIDGKIQEGRITIPLQRDAAWKATPVDGNNANQVMNLNFENDFNRYLTSILLPTYKEALLTADNKIDLADPALAAFIAFIIAGGGDIFPNSRDLHDLNRLRDAFLTVRKVRGQKRTTLVTP